MSRRLYLHKRRVSYPVYLEIELVILEIRILLKCETKMLSKTDISQLYKKFTNEERSDAIDTLLAFVFIKTIEKPKRNGKTPVFYEITQRGRAWVERYDNHYPY